MSAAFQPRSCGPEAGPRWLREGWETWRRAVGTWLVLEAAVFLVVCAAGGWGGETAFLLLVGFTAPYLGTQLAVAQCLASGKVGWSDVFAAVLDDWRHHRRAYLRAAAVRTVSVTVVLLLLQLGRPSSPESLPAVAPLNPLFQGSLVWSLAWFVCAAFSLGGAVSFLPWLVWKHRLPWSVALSLDREALRKNRASLALVIAVLLLAVACAIFLPLTLPLVASFFAAVLRAAYADIFDDGAGVKDVRRASSPFAVTREAPAGSARSASSSQGMLEKSPGWAHDGLMTTPNVSAFPSPSTSVLPVAPIMRRPGPLGPRPLGEPTWITSNPPAVLGAGTTARV